MAVVLYRFDSTEAFPLLESFSDEGLSIDTRVVKTGGQPSLKVTAKRDGGRFEVSEAVLALPPRTVSGRIERIELALVGDRSGCSIVLDAEGRSGALVALACGQVDFEGLGSSGCDRLLQEKNQVLQLHRLRIVIGPTCAVANLILLSLSVYGDVRSLPSGMAQNLPKKAQ